ncbi:MAG TPA: GAF domain-containing protein, partial [Anaerolineae bacterium]
MKAKATELEQRVELLQHRVQEEETRFRNMLVRSADGVLIVDRAGAVRFVNPAAESILGRPAQKLLGAEFGVPLVVNDRVEIDLVREPGQLRIAELRVIDIEWDGQPAHLASLRDVTEYKRAEQAEREARVLAEALRDSAAALSGTLYLDEVLDRILVQTGRVVPHDAASVLLMESGVVRVARVHNPADRALLQWGGPFRIDVGDSPALRHMADTGETLVISDTHQEPGWTSQLETGWINQSEMGRIGSFVGAPIRAGDQVYGFLVLVSTTRGFYHPLHAQRLSIFADQAAAALQNARLHQATLRAAESRAVLHRASHEVATSLDPEQVYVATHRAVENLMPAEAFSIALLDETRQEIEAVYLYDRRGRVAGMRIPAQRGLSGHVIATGRPVRIDDLETGAGIDVVHFGDPVHVRSVIAVPMRQGDKVFGMLSTQSYRPHAFTDGDVQMLDLLANQATTAIVNAQLFAAERQRRQELEAIYQASLGVVASLDVRQVLGAIVRSATRLVPLLDAHIFLYDGETLTFGAAGSQAGAMSEPFAEP